MKSDLWAAQACVIRASPYRVSRRGWCIQVTASPRDSPSFQLGESLAELSQARGSFAMGASTLTAAELRLLPMLATHLSFTEIGRN